MVRFHTDFVQIRTFVQISLTFLYCCSITSVDSRRSRRYSRAQGEKLEIPPAQKLSLRSRRYSRAQGGKLEIPPAQKLRILSSAHRAHGSAHTNVFALENQSERELLIMLLAGLQCSKRCQFNNCFVFFCHGEQNNSTKPSSKHTR